MIALHFTKFYFVDGALDREFKLPKGFLNSQSLIDTEVRNM